MGFAGLHFVVSSVVQTFTVLLCGAESTCFALAEAAANPTAEIFRKSLRVLSLAMPMTPARLGGGEYSTDAQLLYIGFRFRLASNRFLFCPLKRVTAQ